LWQARKTKTSIWKLEIMTPLGNISLNKILKKIARMFMKQSYGHAFQLIKGCFALIGIRHYKLNGKVSNIATHGKGEEVDVPRLMLNGIFD
jgi:hypothetical protein